MMADIERMPRLKGVNAKNKNRVSKVINKSKKQTKKEQEQARSNFQQRVLDDEIQSMEQEGTEQKVVALSSAFANVKVNESLAAERVPNSLKEEEGDADMDEDEVLGAGGEVTPQRMRLRPRGDRSATPTNK